ncbi:hypothetical protein MPSEU_000244600 [Mayamaea pseudoterrestris]|nr:hypothetical protein MPSEU_000244600 [Mayamaea pseudoterrestris]
MRSKGVWTNQWKRMNVMDRVATLVPRRQPRPLAIKIVYNDTRDVQGAKAYTALSDKPVTAIHHKADQYDRHMFISPTRPAVEALSTKFLPLLLPARAWCISDDEPTDGNAFAISLNPSAPLDTMELDDTMETPIAVEAIRYRQQRRRRSVACERTRLIANQERDKPVHVRLLESQIVQNKHGSCPILLHVSSSLQDEAVLEIEQTLMTAEDSNAQRLQRLALWTALVVQLKEGRPKHVLITTTRNNEQAERSRLRDEDKSRNVSGEESGAATTNARESDELLEMEQAEDWAGNESVSTSISFTDSELSDYSEDDLVILYHHFAHGKDEIMSQVSSFSFPWGCQPYGGCCRLNLDD